MRFLGKLLFNFSISIKVIEVDINHIGEFWVFSTVIFEIISAVDVAIFISHSEVDFEYWILESINPRTPDLISISEDSEVTLYIFFTLNT